MSSIDKRREELISYIENQIQSEQINKLLEQRLKWSKIAIVESSNFDSTFYEQALMMVDYINMQILMIYGIPTRLLKR